MNANERFEYMAELFYRDTGMLAPGKDQSGYLHNSPDERQDAWKVWTDNFYEQLFNIHKFYSTKDLKCTKKH